MNSQLIETCFQAIKDLKKLQEIQQKIDEIFHISQPQVQPLTMIDINNKEHENAAQIPFVPSTELLKAYQSTFSKVNQDQRIANTKNYKLSANFSQAVPPRNQVARQKRIKILDQPVLVQDKQAIILEELKQGKIEATIPFMEQTLFNNELGHLQQKDIFIENTLPLSQWKKLRSKFTPK